MIREPLGFHNNIQSGIGRKEYSFNPKSPKPFVLTKRAQNLPNVDYDFNFTSKVVEQIATDEFVQQVRENFNNIQYIPKISRIASIHSNGVKRGGFEKMTQTSSPVNQKAKQVEIKTPFYTAQKDTPSNKFVRRSSEPNIKKFKKEFIFEDKTSRTIGVQGDSKEIKPGKRPKARKNNPFNVADTETQTE